jgi:hypothetical protein
MTTTKPKTTSAHSLVRGSLQAVIFDPAKHAVRPRYVSHFATCPHSGAHRR